MKLQNPTYATARNRIRSVMLEDMLTMEDIDTEVALRNAFDRVAIETCNEAERLGVGPNYLEDIDNDEDFYAVEAELKELAARAVLTRRKKKRAEYRVELRKRVRRWLRRPFYGD